MAINVTIPIEKLQARGVPEALSHLMLALGNHSGRVALARSSPPVTEPPRQARKAPAVPEPSPPTDGELDGYRAFAQRLPEPSRRFLQLLEERGELTISEAMKALKVDHPKSLGGITGSITRWARERNVDVPFVGAKTSQGERLWRWNR
jgi:hypothetical protein